MPTIHQLLPIELIFNPNWWHQTAGINFDKSFYFDPQARIENDVVMRRVLYERYGEMGMGEPDPQPRPIIGSMHVAGGFIIPALLGCEVWFEKDAAPQPMPLELTPEQVDALEKPDFRNTWPMNELIAQMDALEARVGLRGRRYEHGRATQRRLSYLRPESVHRLLQSAGACQKTTGLDRRTDCRCGALSA